MEESPGQSSNSSSKKDRSTTYLMVHVSLASILTIHAFTSFYRNALWAPEMAHSASHLGSCILNCWGTHIAVRTGITVNIEFPMCLGISQTQSDIFILPDPLSLSQSPQHGDPSPVALVLSVLLTCLELLMKRETFPFLRQSLTLCSPSTVLF